ncbi:MAG: hypothetical protein IJL32_01965 [Oscillospiraceae bacterium]|nr:hypothetical protein [Oscillospiraceae bacterium]
MKCKIALCCIAALFLTGCGTNQDLSPLMELKWFSSYEDVKSDLSGMQITAERESSSGENVNYLIDCTGAELFSVACELTLCCTSDGLVGFNYHDTAKTQDYKTWFNVLESHYGYPTEEGSGIASWYANPVGENTAVYLFNLREGVQISFYVTDATPEQKKDTGDKKQKAAVITPELRSPVIPVEEQPEVTETDISAAATENAESVTAARSEHILHMPEFTAPVQEEQPEITTVTYPQETVTTETVPSLTTAETDIIEKESDPKAAYLPEGLAFYDNIKEARRVMRHSILRYDYRLEDTGQPWSQILEYSDVSYLGEPCDAALCFTSLGLVGINYFDASAERFSFWKERLTAIYGEPDSSEPDYVRWTDAPVGDGTAVYVFALADGVQISFYSDDTGSELTD